MKDLSSEKESKPVPTEQNSPSLPTTSISTEEWQKALESKDKEQIYKLISQYSPKSQEYIDSVASLLNNLLFNLNLEKSPPENKKNLDIFESLFERNIIPKFKKSIITEDNLAQILNKVDNNIAEKIILIIIERGNIYINLEKFKGDLNFFESLFKKLMNEKFGNYLKELTIYRYKAISDIYKIPAYENKINVITYILEKFISKFPKNNIFLNKEFANNFLFSLFTTPADVNNKIIQFMAEHGASLPNVEALKLYTFRETSADNDNEKKVRFGRAMNTYYYLWMNAIKLKNLDLIEKIILQFPNDNTSFNAKNPDNRYSLIMQLFTTECVFSVDNDFLVYLFKKYYKYISDQKISAIQRIDSRLYTDKCRNFFIALFNSHDQLNVDPFNISDSINLDILLKLTNLSYEKGLKDFKTDSISPSNLNVIFSGYCYPLMKYILKNLSEINSILSQVPSCFYALINLSDQRVPDYELIISILKHGACYLKDKNGYTALDHYALKGEFKTIQKLADSGIEIKFSDKILNHEKMLDFAIANKNIDLINRIIESAPQAALNWFLPKLFQVNPELALKILASNNNLDFIVSILEKIDDEYFMKICNEGIWLRSEPNFEKIFELILRRKIDSVQFVDQYFKISSFPASKILKKLFSKEKSDYYSSIITYVLKYTRPGIFAKIEEAHDYLCELMIERPNDPLIALLKRSGADIRKEGSEKLSPVDKLFKSQNYQKIKIIQKELIKCPLNYVEDTKLLQEAIQDKNQFLVNKILSWTVNDVKEIVVKIGEMLISTIDDTKEIKIKEKEPLIFDNKKTDFNLFPKVMRAIYSSSLRDLKNLDEVNKLYSNFSHIVDPTKFDQLFLEQEDDNKIESNGLLRQIIANEDYTNFATVISDRMRSRFPLSEMQISTTLQILVTSESDSIFLENALSKLMLIMQQNDKINIIQVMDDCLNKIKNISNHIQPILALISKLLFVKSIDKCKSGTKLLTSLFDKANNIETVMAIVEQLKSIENDELFRFLREPRPGILLKNAQKVSANWTNIMNFAQNRILALAKQDQASITDELRKQVIAFLGENTARLSILGTDKVKEFEKNCKIISPLNYQDQAEELKNSSDQLMQPQWETPLYSQNFYTSETSDQWLCQTQQLHMQQSLIQQPIRETFSATESDVEAKQLELAIELSSRQTVLEKTLLDSPASAPQATIEEFNEHTNQLKNILSSAPPNMEEYITIYPSNMTTSTTLILETVQQPTPEQQLPEIQNENRNNISSGLSTMDKITISSELKTPFSSSQISLYSDQNQKKETQQTTEVDNIVTLTEPSNNKNSLESNLSIGLYNETSNNRNKKNKNKNKSSNDKVLTL